jgi:ferredoxin
MGQEIYEIDPHKCTECVGHFDEPQCVVVCPVECIDPDPEHPEGQEALLAKLRRLEREHPEIYLPEAR